MAPGNGEIVTGPFRKARAKKPHISTTRGLCGDEGTRDFVEMLNYQVFKDISTAVGLNKSAGLDQIIESYNRELEKVVPCDSGRLKISGSQTRGYPCYFKHKFPINRYFTDSFLALASVLGTNPLADKNDALSCLLDQEPECQEGERFSYISIRDVVKSKGNAIHGPKRESIGKFNRKLFETYSREIESALQSKLVVNLKFYPNLDFFLGSDQVLSSDYVSVVLFDGPRKIRIGGQILIIHESSEEKKFCTIKNKNFSVLARTESADFCSALNTDKNRVDLMYLPTLSLYSIEFLCENSLTFAYDSFFRSCPSSTATQQ